MFKEKYPNEVIISGSSDQRNKKSRVSPFLLAPIFSGYITPLLLVLMVLSPAVATPITTTPYESTWDFSLSVVGGDFDLDDVHVIDIGVLWAVDVTITEDAGLINDVLTISGTAQHIVPPHGEGVNTNIFSFNFVIDADDYSPGNHFTTQTVTLSHLSHDNVFTADLNFTTTTTLNVDDITGYTLLLSGVHTPEPATICLLGLGGLALRRRRRAC